MGKVLTKEDKADILALANYIQIVGISNVEDESEIQLVKEFLSNNLGKNHRIKVFAKISSAKGVENLSSFINTADGIIVSRLSLGIDLEVEKVFLA